MCRFKGLDLVDRVPGELWTGVCDIVQEAVTKTVPNKKEFKKEKQLSEQPLQIAEETRKAKSKRERQKAKEKGKDLPNQMQSSREQQGEIRRPS